MSGDFQEEIECLGIEASPSFVREPQGNGVAERFIRTSHGDVQVKGVVLG
jgi:transposase InsO family protein